MYSADQLHILQNLILNFDFARSLLLLTAKSDSLVFDSLNSLPLSNQLFSSSRCSIIFSNLEISLDVSQNIALNRAAALQITHLHILFCVA